MAKKPKGKARAENAQPKPTVQRHITTVEEVPEEDESRHVVFDPTVGAPPDESQPYDDEGLDAWGPPGEQAASEMSSHSAQESQGTDVSPNAQGEWPGSPTSPAGFASTRSSFTKWQQVADSSSQRWSSGSRTNSQANIQSSRNSSAQQTQRQSMEPAPVTYAVGPDQARPMISAAAVAGGKSKHSINGKEDTGWGISPRESVLLDHSAGWRNQPGKTQLPPPRKGDPAWMKWGRDTRGAPLANYAPSRTAPVPPTASGGSHQQQLSNRLNDILQPSGQPQPSRHANTMPARGSRAQPGWPSNSTDGWHRSRRSSRSVRKEETWGGDEWGAPADNGRGRSSRSGTRKHQDDWDEDNEWEVYDDAVWEAGQGDGDNEWGQAAGSGGGGGGSWGNQGGDDWGNEDADGWGDEGGEGWNGGGGNEWAGGNGWGKPAKSDKSAKGTGGKRGNGQDAWATPISQGWDQVDEWGISDPRRSRTSKTRSASQDPPPLSAATPGASYPLPSKTMAYAMRGEKYTKIHDYVMPRKPMGDYANVNFNESYGAALKDLERALYSRSRPAKERIHWAFSPDKDERVASLLAWIQLVSVGLGSFGLHKFLQTRERGALISNADYVQPGKPDEPTFDWLTFDQLQPTMDKVMQESVATYNPALHVIVFVVLPSKTKNSIAVWRRKIIVPYNLRTAYVAEIKQAVKLLKKDYVCMVEELPGKEPPVPVPPPPVEPEPSQSPIRPEKRRLLSKLSINTPPPITTIPDEKAPFKKKKKKWWHFW